MSDTVEIPSVLWHRINRVLLKMEPILEKMDKERDEWVSEAEACRLLGCKRRKLFTLKGHHIIYNPIGRKHLYSRRSIEKYIKSIMP